MGTPRPEIRKSMQASVMFGFNEKLELEDVTLDRPLAQEIRVEVAATGICHSDRHAYSGGVTGTHLPTILGHEAAGIVVEVGNAVRNVRQGDHVVISPAGSCGACSWCSKGHPQHCTDLVRSRPPGFTPRVRLREQKVGQFAGIGSFAEEILVQESSVAKISKKMPLDRAALLGCAVTTGLGSIIHSAGVQLGQTLAVIGCGGVGLSAIQGARLAGANRIIAIDTVSSKLELARKFGATDVLDASVSDPVNGVLEITGGVDHALEFVGNPKTTKQAFQMLATRGIATIVGLAGPDDVISLPAQEFLQEKIIQGSRLGGTQLRTDIPMYANWYLEGRLDLDPLLGQTIDLASVAQAFESGPVGESARTVVTF